MSKASGFTNTFAALSVSEEDNTQSKSNRGRRAAKKAVRAAQHRSGNWAAF
jgi:hypothetical protein